MKLNRLGHTIGAVTVLAILVGASAILWPMISHASPLARCTYNEMIVLNDNQGVAPKVEDVVSSVEITQAKDRFEARWHNGIEELMYGVQTNLGSYVLGTQLGQRDMNTLVFTPGGTSSFVRYVGAGETVTLIGACTGTAP